MKASEIKGKWKFVKHNETDLIYWVENKDYLGLYFSFDQKEIFSVDSDYGKLNKEQKEIFDKENPYFAELFSGDESDLPEEERD